MFGDLLEKLFGAAVSIGAGSVFLHQLLNEPVEAAVKDLLELKVSIDNDKKDDEYHLTVLLKTLREYGGSDENVRKKAREIAYRYDRAMREFHSLIGARGESESELQYRIKSYRRKEPQTFVDFAAAIYAHADSKNEYYSVPARQLADYVDEEMARIIR